jgi:MFS family permease
LKNKPGEEKMKTEINSDVEKDRYVKAQVIYLGLATFFMITAVSLISSNKPEFVALKIIDGVVNDLIISHYDTVLYLAYLIVGILSGIIANRLGKRRIFIMIGTFGAGILFWLLIIIPGYEMMLILRFIQGSFTVLGWQIIMTILLDISNTYDRGRNMGIYGIFLALGMGIGPMIGGYIAELGIFAPYYTAVALNFVAFFITILLIKEPSSNKIKPSLKEKFKVFKNNFELIIPGIYNFVDRLHMGFNLTILVLFMAELGQDPSIRGMVLGLYALPFILLQYPVGKLSDKHGRYKFLIPGSIGYGVVLCITGYVGSISLGLLITLYIILGIFSGLTGPPSMALVGDIADKENNAMAMGFFNFVGNLGIVIGPLIGGIISYYFDYGLAYLCAGIIELISLAICILISRKYKKR